METNKSFSTALVAIVIIFFSVGEVKKSILILTTNEVQLLFVARVGLYILRLFGISSEKYKEIMDEYKKNMKLYSVFTIIGAAYFILISIGEIIRYFL